MAVEAMTGLIPVVVAGGVVLKFTDAAMPRRDGYSRRRRSRSQRPSRRRGRRVSQNGFELPGNYSNVGF